MQRGAEAQIVIHMWSDNLSVVERVTTSLDRNVVRRSWDNGDLWLVASDWLDCFGASDTLSRTGYVRGTLPLMRRQWPAISNDPWSMNTSCNWRTRFSRLHAAGYVLFTSTWLSNGRPPPFSLLLRAVKIRIVSPRAAFSTFFAGGLGDAGSSV